MATIPKDIKNNEDLSFLGGYLRSHIPPEILGTGGLNSSGAYFNIWSLYKQWTGPISILMKIIEFKRKNKDLAEESHQPRYQFLYQSRAYAFSIHANIS